MTKVSLLCHVSFSPRVPICRWNSVDACLTFPILYRAKKLAIVEGLRHFRIHFGHKWMWRCTKHLDLTPFWIKMRPSIKICKLYRLDQIRRINNLLIWISQKIKLRYTWILQLLLLQLFLQLHYGVICLLVHLPPQLQRVLASFKYLLSLPDILPFKMWFFIVKKVLVYLNFLIGHFKSA